MSDEYEEESNEMITVRVHVSTRYINSGDYEDIEIEREVWENMSEKEKDDFIMDSVWNMVDIYHEVL